MTRRLARSSAAVLAVAACLVVLARPVAAQDTGWTITSFDVSVEVVPGSELFITEEIAVDFRSLDKHGIYRVLPVRYELPAGTSVPEGEPGDWLRELDVHDIRVGSPTGAPSQIEIERPGIGGTDLSIRIGDPDRTVSGRHTYLISYRVGGGMNEVEGQPELYWDATGDRWPVPIESAGVRVAGPAPERAACFSGAPGSASPCEQAAVDGDTARFATGRSLAPGEQLTVAVRYPAGAVDVPAPLLRRRWTLQQAFIGSPWVWPLTALTALVGFGGVGLLLAREGRDRVTRGGVQASGRLDPDRSSERRRGLLEPRPVPVEFRPPQDLRPGQLGLLVDERVDPVDISATIVDLAVRGYLTIEEDQREVLWVSRTDWILRRREPADEEAARPLLRYERRLLEGLFESGDEVRVSALKGSFATDYQLAETDLYDDAQTRGWFARRPDRARSLWLGVGIALTVAAIVATVVLSQATRVALAGVPLVIAGLVLALGHRWMPRRTGRGSALLTSTLGFREFIETADADRLRFAEAEGLFLPYLPYAVVFGETERWARAFADLGVDLSSRVSGWYIGHGAFNAARFSSGISDFSHVTSSALSTAPSSSGGAGFSGVGGSAGGGFGGGGGGSW